MDQSDSFVTDGKKAARAIELARKARHARHMAAEFVRRWAVEQTVGQVGLVALSAGHLDLPCHRSDEELQSSAAHDA